MLLEFPAAALALRAVRSRSLSQSITVRFFFSCPKDPAVTLYFQVPLHRWLRRAVRARLALWTWRRSQCLRPSTVEAVSPSATSAITTHLHVAPSLAPTSRSSGCEQRWVDEPDLGRPRLLPIKLIPQSRVVAQRLCQSNGPAKMSVNGFALLLPADGAQAA